MNLLKKFQKEINELHLSNKLAIARFLYIRTEELFDYDSSYDIYGYKKSKKIYDKIFDVYDIKYFYFVCASWARLYVELLNAFSIFAKYIEESGYHHAYVKFSIKKKKFKADIAEKK